MPPFSLEICTAVNKPAKYLLKASLSSVSSSIFNASRQTRVHFFTATLTPTNHIPLATRTRISLSRDYKVKDLGTVQHIIGRNVDHSATVICISQPGYIASVLNRFRMSDAKTFSSPIAPELLSQILPPPKHLYTSLFDQKSLIVSLRYLAECTRPDTSFIWTDWKFRA